MKKKYIQPTCEAILLQNASLCLTSIGVDSAKSTGDSFTSREGWTSDEWDGVEEEGEL